MDNLSDIRRRQLFICFLGLIFVGGMFVCLFFLSPAMTPAYQFTCLEDTTWGPVSLSQNALLAIKAQKISISELSAEQQQRIELQRQAKAQKSPTKDEVRRSLESINEQMISKYESIWTDDAEEKETNIKIDILNSQNQDLGAFTIPLTLSPSPLPAMVCFRDAGEYQFRVNGNDNFYKIELLSVSHSYVPFIPLFYLFAMVALVFLAFSVFMSGVPILRASARLKTATAIAVVALICVFVWFLAAAGRGLPSVSQISEQKPGAWGYKDPLVTEERSANYSLSNRNGSRYHRGFSSYGFHGGK